MCRKLTRLNLEENMLGEAGYQLAQSIRSWGDEPMLQQLWLNHCSLTATASLELVQPLSMCRKLSVLGLGENMLGTAGHQLAQSIRSWGDEPILQQLWLYNCSLTAAASLELVQSLSTCRKLSVLGLEENILGEAGYQLAQSMRSWGYEPMLQQLWLYNCSLIATASFELVQSLSMCRKLTTLNLGKNMLGEVGHQLAQSVRSWGDEPMLQQLWLYNCSLTATASLELVQSRSTCRKLTRLNLGENVLGEAGHQLAQSITSWGDGLLLQEIWLYNCSLTATASLELVQSLSMCRKLTTLNLGQNILREAGHQLAQSIRSWGDKPSLQELRLYNCSLTESTSLELVQSLIKCRQLTALNLGGNSLGEAGHQLSQSIRNWGDNPPLQIFCVPDCFIPAKSLNDLLKSLSRCRLLTELTLSQNPLGKSADQLTQTIRSWRGDGSLKELYLFNCSLSKQVCANIFQALSTCRHLTHLNLGRNTLGLAGNELTQYIISQGDSSQLQVLLLKHCMIPAYIWNGLFQALA